MSLKSRAIEKASQIKKDMVEKKKSLAELNRLRAFDIPEIKSAHEEYAKAKFACAIGGKADAKAAYETYQNALLKNGFDEKDFSHTPTCEKCGDSGYIGGKMCDCLFDIYVSCLSEVCDIFARAPYTFENCNLDAIQNKAQKETYSKLYPFMQKFAQKLPNTSLKLVTLSGAVGTGKTFLASAVAREAIAHGNSVSFVSSYEFTNTMLTCHTSPVSQRKGIIDDIITADLLVIDDLGTEPMLKNVTVEYLLLVLNERTNAGLATVITTNLDGDDIMQRYGERIYSRLSDKRRSKFFRIDGDDLRSTLRVGAGG